MAPQPAYEMGPRMEGPRFDDGCFPGTFQRLAAESIARTLALSSLKAPFGLISSISAAIAALDDLSEEEF